ncbi:MAG: polymer-forming cytoskeletal protein [Phycisphaerales bacterium]|nr:polymer-forming cytoskeletal protein [Phycisphaerales bacterium]
MAQAQRTVQCYHCRHRFPVGARAMTLSCPKCSKALRVDDIIIKTVEAVRKLQTCGSLTVTKKGRIIAQHVEAHGGVECEGIMEANVLSGGPVRIAAKSHWKGDCRAPSVSIEPGCVITGGMFVIPDNTLGLADLPGA